MISQLSYSGRRDRAYGLTGTAIAIVVLDAAQYLDTISLDAPAGEGVGLTPGFFFSGNPRMSARIAWNDMLRQLQLSSAMVTANAICRSYVQHRRKLTPGTLAALRDFLSAEAARSCGLDDDECRIIFDKTFDYFDRLFSYAAVHETAADFAALLDRQGSVTAREALERLGSLSMI